MTAINPPLYLQGGIYPATTDATGIAAPYVHDDAAQQVRSGVIFNNLGSLRVSGSGATSVAIADGRAVVDNGQGGAYLCTNRGSVNLAIPATGASPRRDIIGVQVLDAANGDTGDIWALTRIQGTAQSVPVDPTLPSQYFTPLARIRMPASTSAVQNSYVDDLRVFTAAAGGVIVCTSTTRPAVTRVPYGQLIFETDTLGMKVYNGTYWAQVGGSPIVAVDGSSVGLVVKGFSGQTANLQEWRDSANVLLSRVANTGEMYIGANQVATVDDTVANALLLGGTAAGALSVSHASTADTATAATTATSASDSGAVNGYTVKALQNLQASAGPVNYQPWGAFNIQFIVATVLNDSPSGGYANVGGINTVLGMGSFTVSLTVAGKYVHIIALGHY